MLYLSTAGDKVSFIFVYGLVKEKIMCEVLIYIMSAILCDYQQKYIGSSSTLFILDYKVLVEQVAN